MQAKAEKTIAKLKEEVDKHIHKEVVYCKFYQWGICFTAYFATLYLFSFLWTKKIIFFIFIFLIAVLKEIKEKMTKIELYF